MRRRILALALLLIMASFFPKAEGLTAESIRLDAYESSNADNDFRITAVHPSTTGEDSANAQSFLLKTGSWRITRVEFYLRQASAVGEMAAQIYSSTSQDVGSALPDELKAESSTVSIVSLPLDPSQPQMTAFPFSQSLPGDTVYAVAIIAKSATTLDAFNFVEPGSDITSATHNGRCSFYDSGGWQFCAAGYDLVFAVWGQEESASGGGGRGGLPETLSDIPETLSDILSGTATGPPAGGILIIALAIAGAVYWFGIKGKRR